MFLKSGRFDGDVDGSGDGLAVVVVGHSDLKVTGGRTSTPALGTLIKVAGTEDVVAAYAATYPVALIAVVLVSQFIIILF